MSKGEGGEGGGTVLGAKILWALLPSLRHVFERERERVDLNAEGVSDVYSMGSISTTQNDDSRALNIFFRPPYVVQYMANILPQS